MENVVSVVEDLWPFRGAPGDIDTSRFYSSDGRGEMATMDKTGDTKKLWDSKNPDEVEDAKRTFEFLVKEKKYLAYAVAKNGDKEGEVLKSFDPKLEKIIFVKPLAGG